MAKITSRPIGSMRAVTFPFACVASVTAPSSATFAPRVATARCTSANSRASASLANRMRATNTQFSTRSGSLGKSS